MHKGGRRTAQQRAADGPCEAEVLDVTLPGGMRVIQKHSMQ
jgi:hypothetical protein